MFLNLTSIPGENRPVSEWVNEWKDQLMNEWMSQNMFKMSRLTHFSVSHDHSGVWMFPLQMQKLVQTVRLQPHRPLTMETQRTWPLTFRQILDKREVGGNISSWKILIELNVTKRSCYGLSAKCWNYSFQNALQVVIRSQTSSPTAAYWSNSDY